ncbi:BarP protein, putative [Trypanosoma vivax Y486]|uniref:BarP protein, putative n=1 Tax=Trypanosoma vivax (strain Y486) TaxID=1055687 RepID=F9WMG2_TRYVY|nr:BarP protein, putative [Trypanosoma vivax Y486]|eukprot:CCD18719.1 BarP protein, putative [Trypanosoma vivax Y486]
MARACLAVPLFFLLTVAETGVGASGHGQSPPAHDDEARRSEAVRKLHALFSLYNETFKALVKRAETLQSEASAAVEASTKVEEALEGLGSGRLTESIRGKMAQVESVANEVRQKSLSVASNASHALGNVNITLMFSSLFTVTGEHSVGVEKPVSKNTKRYILWSDEIVKEMERSVAWQLEGAYGHGEAEVSVARDVAAIKDQESFRKWRDLINSSFASRVQELIPVVGVFLKYVVEKQVAEIRQELNDADNRVIWAENQQGGAIARHVQQVENFLASSQLLVARTELERTSGLFIDTLSAVNRLKDLTASMNNDVIAVRQKAFCRAKAYLRALQQHSKQLKDTLSGSKLEIARSEHVISAARNKVAGADEMAARTRNSALASERKAVSSAAEAQSAVALLAHTTGPKSLAALASKTANEAVREAERANELSRVAVEEASGAGELMRTVSDALTGSTESAGEGEMLSRTISSNVLKVAAELNAVGRGLGSGNPIKAKEFCPAHEGVSYVDLEALKRAIASDAESFDSTNKTRGQFLALAKQLMMLSEFVASVNRNLQHVFLNSKRATTHANEAHRLAKSAAKEADSAEVRTQRASMLTHAAMEKYTTEKASVTCSLMRQLIGARRDFTRLMHETSVDEQRAYDASRVADDAVARAASTSDDDTELAEAAVAAGLSKGQSERLKGESDQMKASVSKNLQAIDTSLASLRGVLLNLIRGSGESTQNTVSLCDESVENVTGRSIGAAAKHLAKYTDLHNIQAACELAREAAAELVRLHKLWRDIDLHAERAKMYAEESVDAAADASELDAAAGAGSDSGTESEAFPANQSGAKDRDNSTAQADTVDGGEGSVLGGNMSWSVELMMWSLVIGLSLLFLTAVCLFSVRRRQAGKQRRCAPPRELAPVESDLQSTCFSFVREPSAPHDNREESVTFPRSRRNSSTLSVSIRC